MDIRHTGCIIRQDIFRCGLRHCKVVERSYISVSGIDLGVEKPAPGLYILREVRVDGTVTTRKVTVR